jgi:hypothetical protein
MSLTNLALTIATNPKAALFLTLDHDVPFPRTLSQEITLSILRAFSDRWNPRSGALNDPRGSRRFQAARSVTRRLHSSGR